MSLQATEAVLLEMDKEGNILHEEKIKIDLVQRGDILKVLIRFCHLTVYNDVTGVLISKGALHQRRS